MTYPPAQDPEEERRRAEEETQETTPVEPLEEADLDWEMVSPEANYRESDPEESETAADELPAADELDQVEATLPGESEPYKWAPQEASPFAAQDAAAEEQAVREAVQAADTYSPEVVHRGPQAGGAGVYGTAEPAVEAGPPPGGGAVPPAASRGPILPAGYTALPRRDSGVAMLLEILPGLVGFLGLGWIYAGNTTAGIIWLVSFLLGNLAAFFLDVITLGCFIPLHILGFVGAVITSALLLNNYIKQHPELFRRR